MRKFSSIALFALLLFGCTNNQDAALIADACAKIVQNYRGIPYPVNVVESSVARSRQVEIEYQSQNAQNIAVEGVAFCQFSTEEENLTLVEAEIDDETLTEEEIAALNEQVDFAP